MTILSLETYLGNSIEATEDKLVNMPIEKKEGPLVKYLLDEIIDTFLNLVWQL